MHFLRFMFLNINYSIATFGNIPKVDTTMNENKMKNQKSS